uniref:Uncharacterized protein n=1 Tax=Panagrolaimus sp. PS1159 TaxID=55785 RepID=A0AC35FZV7_9BILA
MINLHHIYALIILLSFVHFCQANFEDSRCRCTCPSTRYFAVNGSSSENQRRYYTKTNVDAGLCNPQTVVKQIVYGIVNDAHIDAFLANCDCKHESRNTILLKVSLMFLYGSFQKLCVITVFNCSATKVLNRVEAEKNKWKSSVEEQRTKVFGEHSMLN